MATKGREHLMQYFLEANGSLLEATMFDQLRFDSREFPRNAFPEIVGKEKVLHFQSKSNSQRRYESNLQVLREELLGEPTARPLMVEQEMASTVLFESRFIDVVYVYRYSEPKTDCPGVLQHLHLEPLSGICPTVKSISLTREVIDNVGDLRFCSISLSPDGEKDIARLAGISTGASVELTVIPDHILVTKGSYVLRELTESDLQRIGMNANFDDNEQEMVAKVTDGDPTIILNLGKRLRPDYPRFMFEKAEPITPVKIYSQNWKETSTGREWSSN